MAIQVKPVSAASGIIASDTDPSEGQRPTADELLREVTGETLELAAVGDRVREALAAG